MSIIVNGVELTEVIYAGVNLDIVKVKKGTAEAITVFEKMTQLSTPQNVTADGTVVSWDEVENATSYDVLADGASIGTVQAATTETWVINENILFEPTIYYDKHTFPNSSLSSNGQSFDSLSIDDDHSSVWIYYGNTKVRGDTWTNQAYRTVIFNTAPTSELLAWLQANATKQ